MKEPRKIVGVQVSQPADGISQFYFKEDDIMSIEMWKPKKNYSVPIFHTRTGTFTVLTTLEECSIAFSAFLSLDTWNLVNLRKGERLETGTFGGRLYFQGSSQYTGVNLKSIGMWEELAAKAREAEEDDRDIFVNRIDEFGKLEEGQFIRASEVFYVDTWEPKRNYHVPRFYTKDGSYSAGLTFQSCREAMPHLFPAYNGSLINLDLIERIEEKIYGDIVYFKDSSHKTGIARSKAKYLKSILP
ncbi:hypothetical protein PSTEL_06200 [Paenibacillus stellifer]|uniref:HTH LytTR-type domain-containing protein n=1 Tax=Paenibacillus stellifer TaxID=169760 RepID=A0A089LPE6_9BACL|nr:hypothetical protein [Paenibacillus stellifer]AIQ62752.1 hypothetical protein PSTEL_06200 [Paenibacillus stellifer]